MPSQCFVSEISRLTSIPSLLQYSILELWHFYSYEKAVFSGIMKRISFKLMKLWLFYFMIFILFWTVYKCCYFMQEYFMLWMPMLQIIKWEHFFFYFIPCSIIWSVVFILLLMCGLCNNCYKLFCKPILEFLQETPKIRHFSSKRF